MSEIAQERSLQVHIHHLYRFCEEMGYAIAIRREPGKPLQRILDTSNTTVNEVELETSMPGFFFHPYESDAQKHFIKSVIRLTHNGDQFEWNTEEPEIIGHYIEFNKALAKPAGKMGFSAQDHAGDKVHFIEIARQAISAINNGLFHKVVPSRTKKVELVNFDLDALLKRLDRSYPNAFVSMTFIPSAGLWIGASPEILVHTNGDVFNTVSLAGTQPCNTGTSLKDISWKQKEIEEQAYVSRYIINCFKKIRLREFTEVGPKSVFSGNLIHLKTVFTVNMSEVNFPQLGSVMMGLLHPTSAVCGMPKAEASTWLKANEQYDREYFSGFLGPVNQAGTTALYVNLRCMKVTGSHAQLYAGAGITEDSIPENEWMETEYKMHTLLDVID